MVPVFLLLPGCHRESPAVATVDVKTPVLDLPHRSFAPLSLSWRLHEPLVGRSGRLRVFVHLLDEPGSVVRTFDHPWPGSWRPGSRVDYTVDLHQSALAPPLEPGAYALTLGLYDGEGRRWPLATQGEAVDRHEYRVAEVRVPPESGSEPMFQFSPDWLASEPGRDRQILMRRWLTGPGHVRATGLERAGELWLRLLLPTGGAEQELVLTEGAQQQGVVVRCGCGEIEVRLAGSGIHDVVLPIEPGSEGADDSCAIEIAPNFYLLELDSAERHTVSLEVLAWSPQSSRRSSSAE